MIPLVDNNWKGVITRFLHDMHGQIVNNQHYKRTETELLKSIKSLDFTQFLRHRYTFECIFFRI